MVANGYDLPCKRVQRYEMFCGRGVVACLAFLRAKFAPFPRFLRKVG